MLKDIRAHTHEYDHSCYHMGYRPLPRQSIYRDNKTIEDEICGNANDPF